VLDSLERTPYALARHEWWRLITPLFVHSGGWRQMVFNFPAIFVLGSIVERIFTRREWLVLYFTAGVVGEIVGYAWQPHGAGASVAGAVCWAVWLPGSS
jgi:rhomboid protease GluP